MWIRALDIITKAGVPESMVSRMSRPPPEIAHDRTQMIHGNKIPDPARNRILDAGLEGHDHATATDIYFNNEPSV